MKLPILLLSIVLMLNCTASPNSESKYIETADIEFTRCSSDDSMWCLTNNQYIVLMMQLAARKECAP